MNKLIRYIGFYDCQNSPVSRYYATSAVNKMDYIIQSIEKTGHEIDLISISFVDEVSFKLYKSEKKKISDHTTLMLPPSFGGTGKLVRKVRTLWHLIYLFVFLLLHIRKGETVIVYHTLFYFNVILWAKRIKKFKLILEVEEIYQDVSDKVSNYLKKTEYKMFGVADAYFFSTELLDRKLNVRHRPSVINYGTYKKEPIISEKFNDDKIHVVYAGVFSVNKGGIISVASAQFLPENYHVHICGFGTKEEVSDMKQFIADVSRKSKATISYEGLLKGCDYIRLIQKCHIGLSTQSPHTFFNDTSFPSKVLSYMSNGLSVVSIRIKAVTSSAVGPYVCYYDEQNPEQIATAIIQAKTVNHNREVIACLDKDFLLQLKQLFDHL